MNNIHDQHHNNYSPELPQGLRTGLGIKQTLVPVTELKDVSFGSTNSLLAGIAALEKLIQDLPITLPLSGSYHLELKNKELHIFETKKGVTTYEIIGSSNRPTLITQGEKAVVIRIESNDDQYFIVLHRLPFTRVDDSHRLTNPWRSSQIKRESPSESHGGGGSGER